MMPRILFDHLMTIAARRGKIHQRYDVRDPLAVIGILADLDLVGRVDAITFDECARAYHTGLWGGRWQRYQRALADPVNVFDF